MNLDFSKEDHPDACRRFYSWGEFVQYVSEHRIPKNDGILAKRRQSLNWQTSDRWDMNVGLTGALEMASTGWHDGMVEAESISKPIVDTLVSQIERLDVTYDYEGIDIDVGRFVADDPEPWIRLNTEIVSSPSVAPRLITIVHNCTESSAVDADAIVRKGAHVMALIQALEFAGHRVELTVIPFATVGGTCAVTVKQFDEPLDPALTIFALAHPAVLRRLGFIFAENQSVEAQRTAGYGYGTPTNPTCDADIKVNSQIGRIDMNWIRQQLEKQGITLRTPVTA